MKKMKMSKKEKREYLLIISSFLIGCLVTLLLTKIFAGPNIIQNKTKVYEKNSLAASYEKIKDAVVTIETYNGDTPLSTGSGFVYKVDKKAYILTNEHVIDGNRIVVITPDEEEVEGKLLGRDPYIDLAVIEIDKKYAKQVAILGDSSKSNIGDTIFVAGAPLSKRYAGSIASGIISGKERLVQTTIESEESMEWVMKVIQFDAPVNPGNSGGPLLNMNGEVIGITLMKLIQEDIEGMSFAIPIEYATSNIENLEKGKELVHPELGIAMVDVTNTTQLTNHDIEIPSRTKGAVVLSVKDNSSASGKLKKGDIIISMDDTEIKDKSYVKFVLFQHKVGDKMKIKILRNNKEKEIQITLKRASE